jgi:AbrB family looped-hinge helix DNA binding protein
MMVQARRQRRADNRQPPVRYLTGEGKVSSKGWVVIPKEIRDELGIEPGDKLAFTLSPPPPNMKQDRRLSEITIIKIPERREELVDLMTGMFKRKPGKRPLTELLVEEHRREVEEDERRVRESRKRRRRPSA